MMRSLKSAVFEEKLNDFFISSSNKLHVIPNAGLNEIEQLERFVENCQIMIIDKHFVKNSDTGVVYLNKNIPLDKDTKFIYLLYDDHAKHFDLITSMKAFVQKNYWCDFCKTAYQTKYLHKCAFICDSCKSLDCDTTSVDRFLIPKKCSNCKKKLFSENCKIKHLHNYCKKIKKCPHCNTVLLQRHVCGPDAVWCNNCCESVGPCHECFIRKTKKNVNRKQDKRNDYIFFDFEAIENQETHIHEVNLAKAVQIKQCCFNEPIRCASCVKMHTFYNIQGFCSWLFRQRNSVFIAHNMKGYDGIFILQYILKNLLPTDKPPELIANGTKLIMIEFRQNKIIDSASFLPMPLASFSKSFGIKELKKGNIL